MAQNQSISTIGDKYASDSLPWIEKYRPSTLDDLIAHEQIIQILNKLIESHKLPHLLFYGPPGTGKTSTMLACARKMYGEKFSSMILELNASDDRGIEVVREQIKEFAGTKSIFSSGLKLIVLDEIDSMTHDAQSALRRVIEKYTGNARFCLICNYVNKIIPALQSRCTRFRFSPLRSDQIESRLNEVIELENVNIGDGGRESILQLAGGDMRRVLNLLQSTHMAYSEVNQETVYLTAGAAIPGVVDSMFNSLMNDPYKVAYDYILKAITEFGYALCDIITEVSKKVMEFELPDPVVGYLLDKLSSSEHRLSHGASEKLQLGSVVGAFIMARSMMITN